MYEPSGEQLAEVRESGGDQWTVERTEAAAASPLTPIWKSRVASSSQRSLGTSFSASMSPERRGSHPMYVTKWSSNHAGIGFQFNESKSTVTYAGAALGAKACRAVTPIPNSGQWYFEISPKCDPTQPDGSPLGGNTFLGICSAKFSCWDSAWWEGDQRQENESHVFGMWDRGKLTKPSHDRQTEWLENSRFRSGDTIGILCDMDKRTLSLYRNGDLTRDQSRQYQEGISLKKW